MFLPADAIAPNQGQGQPRVLPPIATQREIEVATIAIHCDGIVRGLTKEARADCFSPSSPRAKPLIKTIAQRYKSRFNVLLINGGGFG
jgi:hypothetical protein